MLQQENIKVYTTPERRKNPIIKSGSFLSRIKRLKGAVGFWDRFGRIKRLKGAVGFWNRFGRIKRLKGAVGPAVGFCCIESARFRRFCNIKSAVCPVIGF